MQVSTSQGKKSIHLALINCVLIQLNLYTGLK